MFLPKKFILANELVEKMGIHIANISMLRQEFEDRDNMYDIQKINNCSFINTKSRQLPNNIMVGILSNKFTDMSNKLPCRYVSEEYNATERELTNAGIITGKVTVCGKKFYEFTDEFVETVKGKLTYTLDKAELGYCLMHNQIIGYVQLSKNKYLTWY